MRNEIPLKYILYNALKLSENEKAVIAVLEKQKMARSVSHIAREAGVPRTTADYILRKFLKWRIARKTLATTSTPHWMYNRQLNYLSGISNLPKKSTLPLSNHQVDTE